MEQPAGPRLSLAEALQAEHGHAWDIWREQVSGRHGDWRARRLDDGLELRAPTITDLADLLRGER